MAFAVMATACATHGQPGVGMARYSLSAEALARVSSPDLYGAVEQLRPTWLQPCVTVFRDNREYGGRDALREIIASQVAAVRFIPRGHPRPGAGSAGLSDCPAIQVVTAP